MTLIDAADSVADLLRVHGLAADLATTGEDIELSWNRAAGVWLIVSQTDGAPVLEIIDQRGHGMTVMRRAVADVLAAPGPLVTALRRALPAA